MEVLELNMLFKPGGNFCFVNVTLQCFLVFVRLRFLRYILVLEIKMCFT